LDHPIGTEQQFLGNGKAERFGGLQVDYELKLGWLLDG